MTRHHAKTVGGTVAILALVLSFVAAAPALALAQEGQPAPQGRAPADAQSGFLPVKDLPQQEKLPAAPLVMAAYAFVWVVLLVYVWTVWRRLMKVEREVHDLSARLSSRPNPKN